MKIPRIVLALAACLSLAAHAANGVIEINHARATANPATLPGDTAGYPVSITVPGSYILTSNLSGGIVITASNVTIDLNGFTISGSGVGINQTSGTNATVKNGTVSTMTGIGILLGASARVDNVRAINNGGIGIQVGNGSVVANCTSNDNTGKGISAPNESVLRDNVTFNNTADANPPNALTYLLFPYIANGASLDTMLVVSNTSADGATLPTPTFNGNCTVTYVRGSNGVPITSGTITVNTGQQLTWSLTSGVTTLAGNFTAVAAGFSGYAVAECNFPFAHGVAILRDTTASNFTTTTLPAYVIKAPRFSNQPESLGN